MYIFTYIHVHMHVYICTHTYRFCCLFHERDSTRTSGPFCLYLYKHILTYICSHVNICPYIYLKFVHVYADSVALLTNEIRLEHPALYVDMGWLWLIGSLKLKVSFAKQPYKKNDILQKRLIIVRSLLIVATPFMYIKIYLYTYAHTYIYAHILVLYAYVNIHVYINANIRMYMYTHVQILLSFSRTSVDSNVRSPMSICI